MELLKIFIKDDVPAIGLSKLKLEEEVKSYKIPQRLNLNKRAFKPNYSNNLFLL